MIAAFVIACIVAGTFFFLWQEERDKRVAAEKQIRQLKRKRKPPQKKSTEPVTVEKPKPKREYVIRKPAAKPAEPLLDQKKLAELKEQTSAAQIMLAEIFVEKEEAVAEPVSKADNDNVLRVLEKLFAKEVWTRSEVADLAGPGIMTGNLLERINDYSCSKIDDIVVEEDGDNIYVTMEYKEHLI